MEKRIGKYLIQVEQDECPSNPREDDNLGTMVCFHRRYNLGDKHNFEPEELQQFIKSDNVCVALPLFLFDHSGITMNTTGFSCPWDSGKVGYIYVTKEAVRKEYNVKRITKEIKAKVNQVLLGEVETYDQYIRGDIYGYKIHEVSTCDKGCEHTEELDSCWGFYGEETCMEEAEGIVKYYMENEKELV